MMDDIISFALVVGVFFGICWIIEQLGEKPKKSDTYRLIEHKYEFYDPKKPFKPSDPIITKVTGVTFEGRQLVLKKLQIGDMLVLIQEPNNPYDQNAIKVVTRSGDQVGYIPRDLAKHLSWIFKASMFTRPAKVLEVVGNKSLNQNLGLIIEIYPPTADEAAISTYFDSVLFRK